MESLRDGVLTDSSAALSRRAGTRNDMGGGFWAGTSYENVTLLLGCTNMSGFFLGVFDCITW